MESNQEPVFDFDAMETLDDLDEVEGILQRQDEAMALLERLRLQEPPPFTHDTAKSSGRREGRRWPMPEGVTLELHDGEQWKPLECQDMGIGGARVHNLPDWMEGPAPARLKGKDTGGVLVLADVMWRDRETGRAGLRFEFLDNEERDYWAGNLIDALLARYSLG
jgi:hypothetical protein